MNKIINATTLANVQRITLSVIIPVGFLVHRVVAMPLIELNIRFPAPNQVIVKFDEDETETLDFQSPFNKYDFEDIAWYLETYAAHYIADVDIERAEAIAEYLKILGKKLFNAVFTDRSASRLFDRFQDCDEKRLITIGANRLKSAVGIITRSHRHIFNE
jgi:hypothetical protein